VGQELLEHYGSQAQTAIDLNLGPLCAKNAMNRCCHTNVGVSAC